jgi:hypothetical protein
MTSLKHAENRERNEHGQFTPVYHFSKIRLGKKFIYEIDRRSDNFTKEYSRLRAAAYAFFTRTGRKFKCRQTEAGIEVTRIQ